MWRLLGVAVLAAAVDASAPCCKISALKVTSKGQWVDDATFSTCALAPLDDYDFSVNPGAATTAWTAGGASTPLWLSFAGDSQLRIEFWRLVSMLGGTQYAVSDNFAKIAFNISSDDAQKRVKKDQDPVTVEAKYMDYKFCCRRLGRPDTCGIEIGGDNVTRLHAGFRKVEFWVESFVDFRDLGAATSSFLADNPRGVCVTWKMIAYPALNIVQPLVDAQLVNSVVKVRGAG